MTPLSAFQEKCIGLMNSAPRTHATHCFRSALFHLDQAEQLCKIDPAMAIFRAITAEEEAASGLLRCLAEMDYPNAKYLNPHNHSHKHAVFPFLLILRLFFAQTVSNHFTNYNLHIKEEDGEKRLMLALNIDINGEPQLAYPIPPLNFDVKYLNSDEMPDYSHQINQFIEAKEHSSIKTFLKKEANLRNKILYAGPDGYPKISNLDTDFLLERRGRIIVMINVYLLIFPYTEHQPFVTQALDAFIKMLKKLNRSSTTSQAPDSPSTSQV